MNKDRKKEEIVCPQFNLWNIHSVELTWTDSLSPDPKLCDCSFDDAMSGLDVYVIGLKNGFLTDEKSLVFYNNFSNSDESIMGDFNCCYYNDPGFDQCFYLRPEKLKEKYDEILFVIGRPKTENKKTTSWIDHELVKKVSDEICYINCRINAANDITIKNIEYKYNKYGALLLFKFVNTNDNWEIDFYHNIYNNGLQEIIEKHYKHGTNSV